MKPGRRRASDRLQRLLAMVPWIAAHDGPTIAEVCARFGCREEELLADLNLLFVCGLYPYTPDMLIDVDIAEGRVWIRFANYFSRPLRLTPAEALALVAAGKALTASAEAGWPGAGGSDERSPLERGLTKLAAALGVPADEVVDVEMAPVAAEVLRTLQESARDRRHVEMDYYAYGRDEDTRRVVDPYVVFSSGGQWYVRAYCHSVEDERLFRVDRIRSITGLESTFAPPPTPTPGSPSVYTPRPGDEVVELDLAPAARWVVEEYPYESVEERPAGACRVRLRVSERAWLERLLLRLGPDARVVRGDKAVAAGAARRLLRRYGRPVP